jgi:hypothetical protein
MATAVDPQQVLVISSWGQKWLRYAWDRLIHGSRAEQFAKGMVQVLDAIEDEPLAYAEEIVQIDEKVVHDFIGKTRFERSRQRREKRRLVLKKGNRSRFAASIAKLAYNKFGERPMSESNILVTRKWLQKLLEDGEYKDLRTVDKNLAIDRALFLSFVPTNDFRKMKLAISTRAWEQRVSNAGVFGGIFGKVFGFTKDSGAFLLE